MRDLAMTPIIGPFAQPNLSQVIVAGVVAEHRARGQPGSRFAFGAELLVRSLLRLSAYETSVVMTPSYALDTAYSAVIAGLALELNPPSAELVSSWWGYLVRELLDHKDRGRLHDLDMLGSLLLVAVYEAESDRPAAPNVRDVLLEALRLTTAVTDDLHRRRRARAWLWAGRAACGSGDDELATAIAAAIAKDLRETREALGARPWADIGELAPEFGGALYPPVPGTMVRMPPDVHRQPDVVAAFDGLLDEHDGRPKRPRRPPRRRRKEPPSKQSEQPPT